MKNIYAIAAVTVAAVFFSLQPAYTTSVHETEIVPIGDGIAMEKTVMEMHVPEGNTLPWAYIEGQITDHVPEYPVIIQIFGDDPRVVGNSEGAMHFAQVPVNPDGTYEYRLRVLDVTDGQNTSVFEGDYVVKIFKMIYVNSTLTAL